MIQHIKNFLFGKAATGVHISSIVSTVTTCQPDKVVPISEMHLVIWKALEEVNKQLKS